MLNTNNGTLSWESTSRASKSGSTVSKAPPILEVMKIAVDKILGSLPKI